MTRFWLTVAGGSTLAITSLGCQGQTVEGRWYGRFPFEGAKQCEIRLEGNRSFNVDCDRDAIVGAGQYSWDGRTLAMRFSILTRGRTIEPKKPDIEFLVQGHGNAIDLSRNDERFQWDRTMAH